MSPAGLHLPVMQEQGSPQRNVYDAAQHAAMTGLNLVIIAEQTQAAIARRVNHSWLRLTLHRTFHSTLTKNISLNATKKSFKETFNRA